MTIEKTSAIKAEDNLVIIVYGKGGVGKTTFAASAPNPLILDFENGTKYLGERGFDVDVVRLKGWLTAKRQDRSGKHARGIRDHNHRSPWGGNGKTHRFS